MVAGDRSRAWWSSRRSSASAPSSASSVLGEVAHQRGEDRPPRCSARRLAQQHRAGAEGLDDEPELAPAPAPLDERRRGGGFEIDDQRAQQDLPLDAVSSRWRFSFS